MPAARTVEHHGHRSISEAERVVRIGEPPREGAHKGCRGTQRSRSPTGRKQVPRSCKHQLWRPRTDPITVLVAMGLPGCLSNINLRQELSRLGPPDVRQRHLRSTPGAHQRWSLLGVARRLVADDAEFIAFRVLQDDDSAFRILVPYTSRVTTKFQNTLNCLVDVIDGDV